jgi:hypothetical protein
MSNTEGGCVGEGRFRDKSCGVSAIIIRVGTLMVGLMVGRKWV